MQYIRRYCELVMVVALDTPHTPYLLIESEVTQDEATGLVGNQVGNYDPALKREFRSKTNQPGSSHD